MSSCNRTPVNIGPSNGVYTFSVPSFEDDDEGLCPSKFFNPKVIYVVHYWYWKHIVEGLRALHLETRQFCCSRDVIFSEEVFPLYSGWIDEHYEPFPYTILPWVHVSFDALDEVVNGMPHVEVTNNGSHDAQADNSASASYGGPV